jgi:FkbM family methyltransferase
VSDWIRTTGTFYEQDILDYVAATQKRAGVIVDVGAMIGNHTVYFSRYLEHTAILAFEPLPDNLALLDANVRSLDTVQVFGQALSDRWGLSHIAAVPGNYGHAMLGQLGTVVRTARLDTLLLENVTLLKIDVEGHEPEVLRGAAETIARCKPRILIEDWTGTYASLLPEYELEKEWEVAHQTFLFRPLKD